MTLRQILHVALEAPWPPGGPPRRLTQLRLTDSVEREPAARNSYQVPQPVYGECQSSESHYATPEALSLMPRGLFNLMHSVLRAAVGVLDIALDESYGFGLLAHKTLNVSETLVDLVDVRRNAFCCLLTVAHLLR